MFAAPSRDGSATTAACVAGGENNSRPEGAPTSAAEPTAASGSSSTAAAAAAPTAATGSSSTAAAAAAPTALMGLACVLLSSLLFSVMALCVNVNSAVPALQQAAVRNAVAAVASVAGVACARRGALADASTWLGRPEHRQLLVQRALWGVGGMTAYFYGLSVLALGDAASITFTSVPATAIAARVLLGEPYTWVDAACAVLCMAGVVLIAQPTAIFGGAAVGTVPWLPICTTLFGAVTSAMAYVTVRQLKGADALTITLYFSVVGAVVAPLLLPAFGVHPVMPSHREAALLAVVGLAGWLGQVLLNRGIQLAPAGPASVMRYADIIFALVFQATLLGAPPAPLKVVGALLIMSCVVGVIARSRRRAPGYTTAAPVLPAASGGAPLPADGGAPAGPVAEEELGGAQLGGEEEERATLLHPPVVLPDEPLMASIPQPPDAIAGAPKPDDG